MTDLSLRPRRSRRSVPRTRSGCRGCRIRRKKCDKDRPTCSGCERNGLLCSFAAEDIYPGIDFCSEKQIPRIMKVSNCQQSTTPPSEGKAKQSLSLLASLASRSWDGIYALWDKEQASYLIFEHYSFKTANKICGLLGPGNPFITCIPPLAHTNWLCTVSWPEPALI